MEEQKYYFKISPENIISDLTKVKYTAGTEVFYDIDECCFITAVTENTIIGETGLYLNMRDILSGGTNGSSILTGLTIPILFTQTATDFGYYSVFDGAVLQKDVINNFLFTANTVNPYTYIFYNTSEQEMVKFLELITYVVDWGDGSPTVTLTNTSPLTHTYPSSNSEYKITMTANSPWGISLVEKTVTVPFTGTTIDNPNGTAYFIPYGGSWSATPVNYNYIFSGDSNTNLSDFYSSNYTPIPFLLTGYTESSINDLAQYGPKFNLLGGKFKIGVQVTGTTGCIGTVWGPDPTDTYTAYTINNIDYFDYEDYTLYVTYSSGFTQNDLILSALTKNEGLLNVIDQPEVQTNVFIERGKQSVLEYVERLGEVDNVGDLEKYGYKFFKVKKDTA
jgi:hypothetical protein